jgi:hypothetical protein
LWKNHFRTRNKSQVAGFSIRVVTVLVGEVPGF